MPETEKPKGIHFFDLCGHLYLFANLEDLKTLIGEDRSVVLHPNGTNLKICIAFENAGTSEEDARI